MDGDTLYDGDTSPHQQQTAATASLSIQTYYDEQSKITPSSSTNEYDDDKRSKPIVLLDDETCHVLQPSSWPKQQ